MGNGYGAKDKIEGEIGKMKEYPIIFSTPMVQAILDNRKTQTRRVIKNFNDIIHDWDKNDPTYGPFFENGYGESVKTVDVCPYGKTGDRLWVRETWAYINNSGFGVGSYIEYKADKPTAKYPGEWPEDEAKGNPDAPKWKPSIHMSRWASRITLEITNIRTERLQNITYAEVIAEGFTHLLTDEQQTDGAHRREGVEVFGRFWDSINGKKHPWDSNPWVWVIDFKKEKPLNGKAHKTSR